MLYVFHDISPFFFHTEVTDTCCKIHDKIFKDLGRTAKLIGLVADENYEMGNCTIFYMNVKMKIQTMYLYIKDHCKESFLNK